MLLISCIVFFIGVLSGASEVFADEHIKKPTMSNCI